LQKDFPKLPVIVVTRHYQDSQEDFVQKGFNVRAFFNKPIGVGDLKAKVREILKVDAVPK
jgi:hypothetical protein